ncbi:MAG: hypothetical protein KAW92_05595 [Candidatus Cloacimonetes bacterium]|nr:hypothetical protein [Candidatus Cloacimonadota bacterium]
MLAREKIYSLKYGLKKTYTWILKRFRMQRKIIIIVLFSNQNSYDN